MKEHEARSLFNEVIAVIERWCQSQEAQKKQLLLALQFGSSVKPPLKLISDIDLYLVFDQVPRCRKRLWEMTLSLESQLEPPLSKLHRAGFNYVLSPLIRSKESLERYNSFYLDLPEKHKVIFDASHHWPQLRKRILDFREKYKAVKKEDGLQVVWDLTQTLAPGAFFDPTF